MKQRTIINVLTDVNVTETADALVWLLDTYMRGPTPAVAVPCESCLSDKAVNAKASASHNGEEFIGLRHDDITGYKSRNEADAPFLSILTSDAVATERR